MTVLSVVSFFACAVLIALSVRNVSRSDGRALAP